MGKYILGIGATGFLGERKTPYIKKHFHNKEVALKYGNEYLQRNIDHYYILQIPYTKDSKPTDTGEIVKSNWIEMIKDSK